MRLRLSRLSIPITIALCLLAPPRARAHYVADEFTFGFTAPTANTPFQTYFVSDKVSGSWNPKESLQLKLDLSWTYDLPSPPPSGAQFATLAENIFNLSLLASWDMNDHWNVSAQAVGSPPSTLVADSSIDMTTVRPLGPRMTQCPSGSTTDPGNPMQCDYPGSVDAQLSTRTWSTGGTLGASYDTAGDSNHETSVDLSFTGYYFNVDQKYLAAEFRDRKGMQQVYSVPQLITDCNQLAAFRQMEIRKGVKGAALLPTCPAALVQNVSADHVDEYGELIVNAIVTETLHQNTDIGLSGSYYYYTQDPTTIGNFGVQGLHVSTSSSGNVAIAPYVYTVSPDISQRYKGFSADLSFLFGQYVGNPGDQFSYDLTFALKLQYKFSRRFRMWLKGSGQRDVDTSGGVSYAGSASLGARATW